MTRERRGDDKREGVNDKRERGGVTRERDDG
jgi:hypothetical protein